MNESWNKFDPGRAEPSPPVLAAATQPWTNTDTHTLYFLSTLPAFPIYFSCICCYITLDKYRHTHPLFPIYSSCISYLFVLDFLSTFSWICCHITLDKYRHTHHIFPIYVLFLHFLIIFLGFSFYFFLYIFAATWPWTNTNIHTYPYILILISTFSIGFSLDFKSTFEVPPVRFPMKCSFFWFCTSFFVLSL